MISGFLSRVLRTVFKLALVVFTVSLVLGLIVFAVVATLLASVWSLVTGRRPAVFTTFTQFRQAAQQFRQRPPFGGEPPAGGSVAAA